MGVMSSDNSHEEIREAADLFSCDEISLMADLGTTISWMKQYFVKNSEPVVNMFQVLDRMQTDAAGIGAPALSVGFDAIQYYRLQRNEENI